MSTKVSNKINENSSAELPDPRKGKAVRHDVALPLERTSFSTVIYSISGAMLLYLLYYAYIVNQW
ncbi:hypothetical protein DL93DRAFT_2085103 [Clavulina sp. PMI_390]|nr:hypothetical protein DL93DRAFT_2085103 [Clavulina sp. PMI_390]